MTLAPTLSQTDAVTETASCRSVTVMAKTHLRIEVALAAAIALTLLAVFLAEFHEPASPMDEATLLVYPERILKGDLPYRDFETFYGPANPFLLAAVYSITSPGILAERATGLAYRLILLSAIFWIGRRWGSTVAFGCTFIAATILVNLGAAAFAWIGALACAFCSLCLISNGKVAQRCFWAGMIGSGAILLRPDFGPGLLLSVLPMYLLLPRRVKLWCLLGAITGLIPLAGIAAVAGPRLVFENLFTLPVLQTNAGRHIPFFSAEKMAIGLLCIHLAASAANVMAGWKAMRAAPGEIRGRLLLSTGLLGVGLTHQAVQRLDIPHVLFAAIVSLGILPLSLFVLLHNNSNALANRRQALAALMTSIAIIGLAVPEIFTELHLQLGHAFSTSDIAYLVIQDERSFPLVSAVRVRATRRLLDRLEKSSSAGQRLFVGPADLRRTNYNDTFIYHLMPQLRPATYFLEMNPGAANRPDPSSRLMSKARTGLWLDRSLDAWDEPNASRQFGSDASNQIVRAQFETFGRYGPYSLYRRKSAQAKAY